MYKYAYIYTYTKKYTCIYGDPVAHIIRHCMYAYCIYIYVYKDIYMYVLK